MRNWLFFVVLMFFSIGCEQGDVGITPTALTPLPTPAPTVDNPLPEVTTESESPRFELRVWIPPAISADPTTNPSNSQTNPLQTQLDTFAVAHPDVTINLQTKSVSEQGGILSYLRTGRNIAPNVLPDLIAIPSDQLEKAVSEGLVYPLGDLLDVGGMFPAGGEFGRINNIQYGYPFLITDFYHLVYNPNVVTDIFARRWADFTTLDRAEIVLPANSQAGASLLLQLYRGANGSLTDGESAFQFQAPPLTDALNDIGRGITDGFLLVESADMTTPTEAWNYFQSGNATIIFINAEAFLAQRAQGNGSSFAPLPTSRTATSPVVRGWVWAITTPNVERQAISAELITYLTNPQNLGAYSSAMLIPPASSDAFEAWQINAYTTFLDTQLAAAVAYPNRLSINSLNALTTVTVATLKQEITLEEAILQINTVATP